MRILKSGGKLHWIKNLYLRLKDGAGCCDTYSYYNYLSPKIAKGLRTFKKRNCAYPMAMTEEEWDELLDEMIWAFEYVSDDDFGLDDEKEMRAQKAFELFGKHYRSLWY